jgi:hypothetical protein
MKKYLLLLLAVSCMASGPLDAMNSGEKPIGVEESVFKEIKKDFLKVKLIANMSSYNGGLTERLEALKKVSGDLSKIINSKYGYDELNQYLLESKELEKKYTEGLGSVYGLDEEVAKFLLSCSDYMINYCDRQLSSLQPTKQPTKQPTNLLLSFFEEAVISGNIKYFKSIKNGFELIIKNVALSPFPQGVLQREKTLGEVRCKLQELSLEDNDTGIKEHLSKAEKCLNEIKKQKKRGGQQYDREMDLKVSDLLLYCSTYMQHYLDKKLKLLQKDNKKKGRPAVKRLEAPVYLDGRYVKDGKLIPVPQIEDKAKYFNSLIGSFSTIRFILVCSMEKTAKTLAIILDEVVAILHNIYEYDNDVNKREWLNKLEEAKKHIVVVQNVSNKTVSNMCKLLLNCSGYMIKNFKDKVFWLNNNVEKPEEKKPPKTIYINKSSQQWVGDRAVECSCCAILDENGEFVPGMISWVKNCKRLIDNYGSNKPTNRGIHRGIHRDILISPNTGNKKTNLRIVGLPSICMLGEPTVPKKKVLRKVLRNEDKSSVVDLEGQAIRTDIEYEIPKTEYKLICVPKHIRSLAACREKKMPPVFLKVVSNGELKTFDKNTVIEFFKREIGVLEQVKKKFEHIVKVNNFTPESVWITELDINKLIKRLKDKLSKFKSCNL